MAALPIPAAWAAVMKREIFACVPAWAGHLDLEIDCIAAVR
jgi:hypothetical protein